MNCSFRFAATSAVVIALLLSGCGSGGSGGGGGPGRYTIGGTVSGLSGTVFLQDDDADTVAISRNGGFTFSSALATGASYRVTVAAQPAAQACYVANGQGTVASANIAAVEVKCAANNPALQLVVLAGALGGQGSVDANGGKARFLAPSEVAVDASGTLYVADLGNNNVRKVSPGGDVTTLAGTAGLTGSDDGAGPAAKFFSPGGIAVDASGNVYISDSGNHTIRKITSAGQVTTLAGRAGIAGSADGPGASATFNIPVGVTVDASGNLFVADMGNSTIRRVSAGGVVTTLAGSPGQPGSADATGAAARFSAPQGVTVDAAGNVFVADTDNSTIRAITAAGVVTTLAGTAGQSGSTDASGAAARFFGPEALTIDAGGNLYVADTNNATIRVVTPAGVVTTLAGTAGQVGSDDGTGAAARFDFPAGIRRDTSGTLYVADLNNGTVRKISPGGVVTTLAGAARHFGSTDGSGTTARFQSPGGIAADSAGNLYIADVDNNTIRKVSPAGLVETLAGTAGQSGGIDGPGALATFSSPIAIAIDTSGNLYVADSGNSTVRKVTAGGAVSTFAGAAGQAGSTDGIGAAARFSSPSGIATDSSGNVYVADAGNHNIRKITSVGAVTTFAGSAGQAGSVDAVGPAARFNAPFGIAADPTGVLYVADAGNSTVRVITPAGVVSTLAGAAGEVGSTDGIGATARFAHPLYVAVDPTGQVYVADTFNNSIRKISLGGTVTTIAGLPGVVGLVEGSLPAGLNHPAGLVLFGATTLYAADVTEDAVVRITLN